MPRENVAAYFNRPIRVGKPDPLADYRSALKLESIMEGGKPDEEESLDLKKYLESFDDLWNYEDCLTRLSDIEKSWYSNSGACVLENIQALRSVRFLELDEEDIADNEDESGNEDSIDNDETFVPQRLVDELTKKQIIPYLKYITQPKNLLNLSPQYDAEKLSGYVPALETAVSSKLKYTGWFIPFARGVDSAISLGWGALQICFDGDKPGHVAFKYHAIDRVLYDTEVSDLNDSSMVVVNYDVPAHMLEMLAEEGTFSKAAVNSLVKHGKAEGKEAGCYIPDDYYSVDNHTDTTTDRGDENKVHADKIFLIRNVFYKGEDGYIYSCWVHPEAKGFLSKPEPAYLGKYERAEYLFTSEDILAAFSDEHEELKPSVEFAPAFETEYPVKLIIPNIDERDKVVESKGLAYLKEPDQTASTVIWSSHLTRLKRSQHMFPMSESDDNQLSVDDDVILSPNKFIKGKKVNIFTFPAPNMQDLMVADKIATKAHSQTGQTDYSVINRNDARKTATELDSASRIEQDLNLAPIMLWGSFLAEYLGLAAEVVISRARAGKLQLFSPEVYSEEVVTALLWNSYSIVPYGDVEFLQREQDKTAIREILSHTQGSSVSSILIKELVRLMLPRHAETITAAMEADDMKQQMLQQALQVIEAAIPAVQDPQMQQELQKFVQNASKPQQQ